MKKDRLPSHSRSGRRSKDTETDVFILRPLLFGCILGLIISFVILVLLAVLLSVQDIPASAAPPLATTAAGVGAFFAGFTAAKLYHKQGMMIGGLTGFVLFILLFITSLVVASGSLTFLSFIKLLLMLLASAIGGVLALNVGGKRKII